MIPRNLALPFVLVLIVTGITLTHSATVKQDNDSPTIDPARCDYTHGVFEAKGVFGNESVFDYGFDPCHNLSCTAAFMDAVATLEPKPSNWTRDRPLADFGAGWVRCERLWSPDPTNNRPGFTGVVINISTTAESFFQRGTFNLEKNGGLPSQFPLLQITLRHLPRVNATFEEGSFPGSGAISYVYEQVRFYFAPITSIKVEYTELWSNGVSANESVTVMNINNLTAWSLRGVSTLSYTFPFWYTSTLPPTFDLRENPRVEMIDISLLSSAIYPATVLLHNCSRLRAVFFCDDPEANVPNIDGADPGVELVSLLNCCGSIIVAATQFQGFFFTPFTRGSKLVTSMMKLESGAIAAVDSLVTPLVSLRLLTDNIECSATFRGSLARFRQPEQAQQLFAGIGDEIITQSTILMHKTFAACAPSGAAFLSTSRNEFNPTADILVALNDASQSSAMSFIEVVDLDDIGVWTTRVGPHYVGVLSVDGQGVPVIHSFNSSSTVTVTSCLVQWMLVLEDDSCHNQPYFLDRFTPCLPTSALNSAGTDVVPVQLPWSQVQFFDDSINSNSFFTFIDSAGNSLQFSTPFNDDKSPSQVLVAGSFLASPQLTIGIIDNSTRIVIHVRTQGGADADSVATRCTCDVVPAMFIVQSRLRSAHEAACSSDTLFWPFDDATFTALQSCLFSPACGFEAARSWTSAGSGVLTTRKIPDSFWKLAPMSFFLSSQQVVHSKSGVFFPVNTCTFSSSGLWVNATDPQRVVQALCLAGESPLLSYVRVLQDYTVEISVNGTASTSLIDDLSAAAAVNRSLSVFGSNAAIYFCAEPVPQPLPYGAYCASLADNDGGTIQVGVTLSLAETRFSIKSEHKQLTRVQNQLFLENGTKTAHNSEIFMATANPIASRLAREYALVLFRMLHSAAVTASMDSVARTWIVDGNSTASYSTAAGSGSSSPPSLLLTLQQSNTASSGQQQQQTTLLLRKSSATLCFIVPICGADHAASPSPQQQQQQQQPDQHDFRGVDFASSRIPWRYALVNRPIQLQQLVAVVGQNNNQNNRSNSASSKNPCGPTTCDLPCVANVSASSPSSPSLSESNCMSLVNQTLLSFLVESVLLGDVATGVQLVRNAVAQSPPVCVRNMTELALGAALRARVRFSCAAVDGQQPRWWLLSGNAEQQNNTNSKGNQHDPDFEISALQQSATLLAASLQCTTCAPYFEKEHVALPVMFLAISAVKTLLVIFIVNVLRSAFEQVIDRCRAALSSMFVDALVMPTWQDQEKVKVRETVDKLLVAPKFSLPAVLHRLRGHLDIALEAGRGQPNMLSRVDDDDDDSGIQQQQRQSHSDDDEQAKAISNNDDNKTAPLRRMLDAADDGDNTLLDGFIVAYSQLACCNGERLPQPAAHEEWAARRAKLVEHSRLLARLAAAFIRESSISSKKSNNNNSSSSIVILKHATQQRRSIAPSTVSAEDLVDSQRQLVGGDLPQEEEEQLAQGQAPAPPTRATPPTLSAAVEQYCEWAAQLDNQHFFERVSIDFVRRRSRLVPIPFFLAIDLLFAVIAFSVAVADAARSETCSKRSSPWHCYQNLYWMVANSTAFSSLLINSFTRLSFVGGWSKASTFERSVVLFACAFLAPGYMTHCLPAILTYAWFYLVAVLVPVLLLRRCTMHHTAAVWQLALLRALVLFAAAFTISTSYNLALIFVYGNGTPLGEGVRPAYLEAIVLDFDWRAVACSLDRFKHTASNALQLMGSIGPTP